MARDLTLQISAALLVLLVIIAPFSVAEAHGNALLHRRFRQYAFVGNETNQTNPPNNTTESPGGTPITDAPSTPTPTSDGSVCPRYPTGFGSEISYYQYQNFSYQHCDALNVTNMTSCVKAQCECFGLPYDGLSGCDTTTNGKSNVSCVEAGKCVGSYVSCINDNAVNVAFGTTPAPVPPGEQANASSSSAPGLPTATHCNSWADSIRLGFMSVESDLLLYNESYLFDSCNSAACTILHEFLDVKTTCGGAQGANAAPPVLPIAEACFSPVIYKATLVLSGDFTELFNTRYNELVVAVDADLTAILRLPVTIIKLTLGSLIIDFSVPVSSTNPILVAGLKAVVESDAWLGNTKAEYIAAGGNLSDFGVKSLTETKDPTPAPATPEPTIGDGPAAPDNNDNPACDGGCIAGIVLGCIFFLCIVVAISYCCYRHKIEKEKGKLQTAVNAVGGGVRSRHNAQNINNSDPYYHDDDSGDDYQMDEV